MEHDYILIIQHEKQVFMVPPVIELHKRNILNNILDLSDSSKSFLKTVRFSFSSKGTPESFV